MNPAWISEIGLAFDIAGAIVLTLGLLMTDAEIGERSGTYWDENPHMAKALRGDRVKGAIGLALLIVGFLLQAYGQWPRP
ncbi:MAG: hypothetical protein ACYCZX_02665 [Rhodospirillaceae bacterium]